MATRTYTSESDIGATFYYETIANSGQYEITAFNPTVVQFDLDIDTLYMSNVVVTNIGTFLPRVHKYWNNNYFDTRRAYALSRDNQKMLKYVTTGGLSSIHDDEDLRIYNGNSMTLDNWANGEVIDSFNIGHSGIFVGGKYISEIGRFYLFYSLGDGISVGGTISHTWVTSEDELNALLGFFYGSVSADILSLQKVSPDSYFSRGQSSQVEFKLANELGVPVEADITYECDPQEGWSWNESTHTLTYNSGTYFTTVFASTTYNNVEYSGMAAFRPPLGTSPYAPGGTSGFGGGNGNFGQDDRNDNVSSDIPNGSDFGYIGGSIYTNYALSGAQVESFGEWLWTDDLGLSLWKTVMEKLFNETADALVSLMCFPFNIATLPGSSLGDGEIIAGNLNTGIPARVLGSPYASVNWGSVPLYEYWGNFLDYAPHTKLELYLPWSTGFVPLDPHQCVPGSVSVTTNIDLQKGTCTHNVFAGNTVLGVYEGQCGYEVPLLASNFSAKLAGATVAAVSTVVTAGAAAAVGGASAIASGKAMQQVANHNSMIKSMMPGTARNMAGLSGPMTDPGMLASKNFLESQLQTASAPSPIDYSPISHGVGAKIASASSSAIAKQPVNISRNGSFSGSSAGMSVPYPFIVISRPEQNVPTGYGHHFGYPSNITSILGQLKGYTEVGAIHLNGLKALPDEIAELDDILKGGFII